MIIQDSCRTASSFGPSFSLLKTRVVTPAPSCGQGPDILPGDFFLALLTCGAPPSGRTPDTLPGMGQEVPGRGTALPHAASCSGTYYFWKLTSGTKPFWLAPGCAWNCVSTVGALGGVRWVMLVLTVSAARCRRCLLSFSICFGGASLKGYEDACCTQVFFPPFQLLVKVPAGRR